MIYVTLKMLKSGAEARLALQMRDYHRYSRNNALKAKLGIVKR